MARFQQLNKNIEEVLLNLIDNQSLCKLLYYPQDDPFNEKEINDTSVLLYNKIYPFPYVPGVQETAGSFLSAFFDNFKLPSDNKGTKEVSLVFNVIVHKNLWRMPGTGMLRPYSILHEVDEICNSQRIVGIKKVPFDKGRLIHYNNDFAGYQVQYQVTSVN
ncbi:hypothetical protein [Paenibacillus lautus]|uniref:hypothetical protein n=1 Tax=Paenibacillus lautus TaxID=1401 RepID=UPI001C7CF55E|nr:hypothetical protein [Paenibacillus lautus]MBX4152259.1 hypothetical protein [Paenibacillus lautus]